MNEVPLVGINDIEAASARIAPYIFATPFIENDWLSQLAGADRTAMMLLGQDDRDRWLRVALATTHLPLKLVSEHLTRAKTSSDV